MSRVPKFGAVVLVLLACAARSGDGFAVPAMTRGGATSQTRALAGARSNVKSGVGRAGVDLAGRRPGLGTVRWATEQEEKTEAKAEDGKEEVLGNDKLIYDKRSGRFYEKQIEEVCREEYCAIDETTGKPMLLTTGEKERIFMDAIQSFYYNQRQVLEDEDFDKLKEDLAWEGSKVILLSRDETLFMNAMAAYGRGEKIISDEEFDRLKASLRESGSEVAVSTEPKCYIDTGICTVTFTEDLFRRYATYLPANFIFGLLLLGLSWQILYPIRYLNPLATLALLVYPTIVVSKKFTDQFFYQNDGCIAQGPCPSCGKPNRMFFGNILGVEGDNNDAEFKCKSCAEIIKIRRSDLRARTLPKI